MSSRTPSPLSTSLTSPITEKSVLSTFLDVSYAIGFSPCKLRMGKDGCVQLQTSYFHKIFFICLILSTNLLRFTEVRKTIPPNGDWNPIMYFQFLSGSINVVFNLTVALALSRNAERLVTIVNFLRKSSSLPLPDFARSVKFAFKWICIADILLGFGMALADIEVFSSPTDSFDWNITASLWCFKKDVKFTFFLESSYDCGNGSFPKAYNDESLIATASNYGIAFTFCIFKIYRQIFGYFGELALLVGVIELWLPSYAFHQVAKPDFCRGNHHTPSGRIMPFAAKFEVLQEQYNNLKCFSKLINHAFSLMVLWFIIASIFYYSSNLDALFVSNNLVERFRVITFYISALAIFVLAADTSHNVKAFDEWIAELPTKESGFIPQNNLMIILHELDSNKVGIMGSSIFTVTYAFLANMLGVLMTYFIVCVQSRSPWIYSGGSTQLDG